MSVFTFIAVIKGLHFRNGNGSTIHKTNGKEIFDLLKITQFAFGSLHSFQIYSKCLLQPWLKIVVWTFTELQGLEQCFVGLGWYLWACFNIFALSFIIPVKIIQHVQLRYITCDLFKVLKKLCSCDP